MTMQKLTPQRMLFPLFHFVATLPFSSVTDYGFYKPRRLHAGGDWARTDVFTPLSYFENIVMMNIAAHS